MVGIYIGTVVAQNHVCTFQVAAEFLLHALSDDDNILRAVIMHRSQASCHVDNCAHALIVGSHLLLKCLSGYERVLDEFLVVLLFNTVVYRQNIKKTISIDPRNFSDSSHRYLHRLTRGIPYRGIP